MTCSVLESNKQRFIELLLETNRNGINDLISYLESTTFFTDPASAKYHGSFEGGLCAHSLAVYDYFVKLTGRDDETAKIACLLHDVCKIGNYKKIFKNVKNSETGKWNEIPAYDYKENQFPYGHGEKSVIMINQYINLKAEEILMIRWHMGAYESKECWKDLEAAQKMYKSVAFIHFADVLATTDNI